MIITRTPFRMSFFGGGTDMESFFKEYGGAVISTTFDKYCYVNVRHLPRFFDYSTELTYSKSERVSNIDDIQHPAIRNAMKMLDMHEIRLTCLAMVPRIRKSYHGSHRHYQTACSSAQSLPCRTRHHSPDTHGQP